MSTKARKSFCFKCKLKTNQIVLHEVINNNHDENDGWWDETVWQIIRCGGCDTISFRKIYTDVSYQGYEDEVLYDEELYPHRDADTLYGKEFNNVPKNLKAIYEETLSAHNNKQFLLWAEDLEQ